LPTQERQIRVFISSTFQDMQLERNHLTGIIFPQLRRMCEERGVTWGEVDLRWGISDEQKAEGRVLELCLEEIHRCRPYFVGLLGGRYGWIPGSIPGYLLERETWIHPRNGASVTELEIVHGVLGNQELHGHAFFYFRSPDSDPPGTRETDDDAVGKLERLKNRIRAARDEEVCCLLENYHTIAELGEQVLLDFSRLIDRLWPETKRVGAVERERAAQAAFAASRTSLYEGGQGVLDQLDRLIDGPGGRIAVVGRAGLGKSALLANWVGRRRGRPGEAVVCLFVGGSAASVDWAGMLRSLMADLVESLQLAFEVPEDRDALRGAFGSCLLEAGRRSKVVCVIDALEKLEDRDGALELTWMPEAPPPGVKIVVSTSSPATEKLLAGKGWGMLPLAPLDRGGIGSLVEAYLMRYGKRLEQRRLARLEAAPACGNPLYLRTVLEELRLVGSRQAVDQELDDCLAAPDPGSLYKVVLSRWEKYFDSVPHLTRDVFRALWASRRGLSEAELLEVVGGVRGRLPSADWSPLSVAADSALINRQGLLGFSHDFLRSAVEDRYLGEPGARREAHLSLASYFRGQEGLGPRKVEELPWQLAQAGDWPLLREVLSDLRFLTALEGSDPFSMRSYWVLLVANGEDPERAYADVLGEPASNPLESFIVAGLLLGLERFGAAERLYEALIEHVRQTGERHILQACLGNLAVIKVKRREPSGALELYREMETICRETDNAHGVRMALSGQASARADIGDTEASIALSRSVEESSRGSSDHIMHAQSLGDQGLVAMERRDWAEALRLFRAQERVCREHNLEESLLGCLGNQAIVHEGRGEYGEALAIYEQVEAGARRLGNRSWLMRSILNRGSALIAAGRPDEARSEFERALQMARETGDEEVRDSCFKGLELVGAGAGTREHAAGETLIGEGLALSGAGELPGAVAKYREAARILRPRGPSPALARALVNLGVVHQMMGQPREGAVALQEAERILRSSRARDMLATCLANLGAGLLDLGDVAGANRALAEAESICRDTGDLDGLAQCHGYWAHIKQRQGDEPGALESYRSEADILRRQGNRTGLRQSLLNQVLALKRLKAWAQARACAEELEGVCRALGDQRALCQSIDIQSDIFLGLGDKERAVRQFKAAIAMCREVGEWRRLAIAGNNCAFLLASGLGRIREALAVLEEAHGVSVQHSLDDMESRIRPFLTELRAAVRRLR
jgi:nephrocystin-3